MRSWCSSDWMVGLAGSSSCWKVMMQRVTSSGVRIMARSRLMSYRQWCEDHGMEPTDDNAELYVEMTDERMFENQEEL